MNIFKSFKRLLGATDIAACVSIDLPFPPSSNREKAATKGKWFDQCAIHLLEMKRARLSGALSLEFILQDPQDGITRDIHNYLKIPLNFCEGFLYDDDSQIRKISAQWSTKVNGLRINLKPMDRETT